ncbi:MAG: HAMP domain-containing histidine kinase, partial [Nitrospira sp.]|nr:HAMP domain-containing histidine kinase [Nitrospira sp.]
GGEVKLMLEGDDGRIKLSVSDTGPGIPEYELPRIFDRFYQVDKSRSSQGSGLGLSICKWIAEAHQGKITVDSTVGQGSRFNVSLPSKIKDI